MEEEMMSHAKRVPFYFLVNVAGIIGYFTSRKKVLSEEATRQNPQIE